MSGWEATSNGHCGRLGGSIRVHNKTEHRTRTRNHHLACCCSVSHIPITSSSGPEAGGNKAYINRMSRWSDWGSWAISPGFYLPPMSAQLDSHATKPAELPSHQSAQLGVVDQPTIHEHCSIIMRYMFCCMQAYIVPIIFKLCGRL